MNESKTTTKDSNCGHDNPCQSHHHVEHPAESCLRFPLQRPWHSNRGRSALSLIHCAADSTALYCRRTGP
jgi:hypothetical protein